MLYPNESVEYFGPLYLHLNEEIYKTLIILVILMLFSWLLNYRNAKNNVEGNMSDIVILHSLGVSKRHIMFLFLNESLVLFTIIFPLSLISINSMYNALNISYSRDYYLKVYIKNLPIIIFYIIIMIFQPIIIYIVKYIKKAPQEVIR